MVATEEPPALLAVNRAMAKQLGLSQHPLWAGDSPGLHVEALSGPTEVHLSLTERCPAGCKGCYADATPKGYQPSFEDLRKRLRHLRGLGAFTVAFGGGEAALHPDIEALIAEARALGLTPTLTTSGLAMTAARAQKLRGLAQINISYDGVAEVYEGVRGYDGAAQAERAMALVAEAGIPFGVNTVLTSRSFAHVAATAERAALLGAVELQLLRFKPSGRGSLDYFNTRLTSEQGRSLGPLLRRLVKAHEGRMAVRIDCSLVPFLVADASIDAVALQRFGVMGCEPGRSLMTVDARGQVRPCSFWAEGSNVPINAKAWDSAPLNAFRDHFAAAPEPCKSCRLREVCRGGCKVVAGATGAAFRPDPECPRVRDEMGLGNNAPREAGHDRG